MWSLALIDLYCTLDLMSSYFSSAQKNSLCQLCPTEWDKPATFNISFSPRQANVNFTVTFMVPKTHAVTSRATYNTGPTGYSYQLCDDVIYTPRGRIMVVVTVIVFWTCVSCLKSKVAALHAWVICLIFQMFSSESSHWHMVDNEHFLSAEDEGSHIGTCHSLPAVQNCCEKVCVIAKSLRKCNQTWQVHSSYSNQYKTLGLEMFFMLRVCVCVCVWQHCEIIYMNKFVFQ